MNTLLRSASALALLTAALGARAGLLGSTVDLRLENTAVGVVFDSGNAVVVDPIVEFSNINGSSTDPGTADFTNTRLTITENFSSNFDSYAFNGYTAAVVSGPAIISATYVSGFAPTSISVSDGRLFLNYSGVSFSSGQSSVVAITTQPTPEPSALAALGLGALGMLRRRKRA